jgi:hypothetical protein
MARRAPLLRFRVPFSTRRPRRALVPKAAGLRTCPAPAFDVPARPRSHATDLRTANVSPLRFSALPARSSRRRSIRWTLRGQSCDSAFSRVACDAIKRTEPCRLELPSSSVRRAGAVGETDSSHVARTLAADPPTELSLLRRLDLAARVGHAPTRPLRAAFRYPLPGAIARPCRTRRSFPRGLVRRRSWGSFPSQV